MGSGTEKSKREIKEDLLKAHFHAVWQLAVSHLTDRERSELVAKEVFRRAFIAVDEGEDASAVSLQLRAFALEEILRLKEAEPAPVMDVYYGAPGYEPAQAPYAACPPGYPPYYPHYAYAYQPQYAQPPYAPYPPQYQPPQYQPPQYQPPQYQPPQYQQPQYQRPPQQQPSAQQQPPQQQQQQQQPKQPPPQRQQPPQAQQQPPQERTRTDERETKAEEAAAPPAPPELPKEEEWGPAPYEGPTEEERAQSCAPRPIEITPEMEARREKRARKAKLMLGVNVAGCVLMLWVVLGLLHRIGVFPGLDIGYSWFNANVFKVF